MIRHISIFTFSDTPANGKSKAENIAAVRAYLERVPALYPAMKRQTIGGALGGGPNPPDDAPGYAPSKAHTDLVELTAPMMKKVTAIDFEM